MKFQILDHGYVELHDRMGEDLSVVNSARQSFGRKSDTLQDNEKKLINFLMRERHGTPFESVVFTFNVKCPLFVAREWQRHRISSYNEYSGRYSKMIEDFYVPAEINIRSQTGKPGAYKFESMEPRKAKAARVAIYSFSKAAWWLYNSLLKAGIAKEVSRMVLPVNFYTQFTWTINMRSLFNFISLRSHETAMFEIRQYSQAIETMLSEVVPVSYKAFVDSGRKAP